MGNMYIAYSKTVAFAVVYQAYSINHKLDIFFYKYK